MKVYLIYFLAIIFDSIISLVHQCRTIGEECCKNGFLNKKPLFFISLFMVLKYLIWTSLKIYHTFPYIFCIPVSMTCLFSHHNRYQYFLRLNHYHYMYLLRDKSSLHDTVDIQQNYIPPGFLLSKNHNRGYRKHNDIFWNFFFIANPFMFYE